MTLRRLSLPAAVSLLMRGALARLGSAIALVSLLWLIVAWALRETT